MFSGIKGKFALLNAKQSAKPLALGVLLFAASSGAFAAIDVTAAVTGISDVSAAVVSVFSAMLAIAALVWGYRKVISFFGY